MHSLNVKQTHSYMDVYGEEMTRKMPIIVPIQTKESTFRKRSLLTGKNMMKKTLMRSKKVLMRSKEVMMKINHCLFVNSQLWPKFHETME